VSRNPPSYRNVRLTSLAGGMNDTDNETLLRPDESPDVLNIEFNRETIATARGALKFGNQIAPRSGFRTKVDESFSPLFIEAEKALPLRGYGYIPFAEEYDIGGNGAAEFP
jgi:hypothetical protein